MLLVNGRNTVNFALLSYKHYSFICIPLRYIENKSAIHRRGKNSKVTENIYPLDRKKKSSRFETSIQQALFCLVYTIISIMRSSAYFTKGFTLLFLKVDCVYLTSKYFSRKLLYFLVGAIL